MYLKVTMSDGNVALTPLSPSHTLRVIDPGDNTTAAWAFGGIVSVDLEQGDIVLGDSTPAPGGSEADAAPPVAPSEPAPVEQPAEPVVPDPAPADPAPAVDPAADPAPEDPAPAVDPPVEETPAVDPAPADPPADPAPVEDPAHDDAVAAVTQAITDVATAPASTPKQAATKAETLAQLGSDIDSALANWPDSPQLQDAKTQLDALSAEDAS